MAINREFTITHKNESRSPSKGEGFERASRIFAAIAIPLVLAGGGWWMQSTVADHSTKQEYVKTAISILSEKDESVRPLKVWAADLLDATSPVKLDQKTRDALISGNATIPLAAPVAAPAVGPMPGGGGAASLAGTVHFESRSGKSSPASNSAKVALRRLGYRTDAEDSPFAGGGTSEIVFNPRDEGRIAEILSALGQAGLSVTVRKPMAGAPEGEMFVYIAD